jgi:hypothetical protein
MDRLHRLVAELEDSFLVGRIDICLVALVS